MKAILVSSLALAMLAGAAQAHKRRRQAHKRRRQAHKRRRLAQTSPLRRR